MKCPTPKEFLDWLANLTILDRTNFLMLVDLPSAKEIIAKLSPGKYRDMAIYALAVKEVTGESE